MLPDDLRKFGATMREVDPDMGTLAMAVYGNLAKHQFRFFFAARVAVADPALTMEDLVARFMHDGVLMDFLQTVDAGPLGGEVRCGQFARDNAVTSTCIWVDKGSMGFVFFANQAVKTVQPLFVKARSEIESMP